jgi:hypothetical protein
MYFLTPFGCQFYGSEIGEYIPFAALFFILLLRKKNQFHLIKFSPQKKKKTIKPNPHPMYLLPTKEATGE